MDIAEREERIRQLGLTIAWIDRLPPHERVASADQRERALAELRELMDNAVPDWAKPR